MRLTCPSCAAIYEVDDVAIPASGRRVRCSACDEAWRVSGDGAARRSVAPPPISMPAAMGAAARPEEKAPPAPSGAEAPAPETPPQDAPARTEAAPPNADAAQPRTEPAPAPAAARPAPPPFKPAGIPAAAKLQKPEPADEKTKATRAARRNEDEDLSVGPAESALRSVMGFLLGFALVVLIFSPYLFQTQIIAIFPAAEPAVDAYNGVLRKAPDALRDGYDYIAGEFDYLLGGLSTEEVPEGTTQPQAASGQ